jgi:hypothetical protein
MMDLSEAEREILSRVPTEFQLVDFADQRSLWRLETYGLVESRVRPAELPTVVETEWRISVEGTRVLGVSPGNG